MLSSVDRDNGVAGRIFETADQTDRSADGIVEQAAGRLDSGEERNSLVMWKRENRNWSSPLGGNGATVDRTAQLSQNP